MSKLNARMTPERATQAAGLVQEHLQAIIPNLVDLAHAAALDHIASRAIEQPELSAEQQLAAMAEEQALQALQALQTESAAVMDDVARARQWVEQAVNEDIKRYGSLN